MRILLMANFAIAAVFTSTTLTAQDHAKPKALPATVEARWVHTVESHKTADGATVAQVLAYAAKMRPKEFKEGEIGVGYNGATGEPDSVYIGYYLGAKRLPDDAYVDLGYDMAPDGQLKPVDPNATTTIALEGGRQTFLKAVDEAYKTECRPDPDEQPDC